jgi:hypothetical protein
MYVPYARISMYISSLKESFDQSSHVNNNNFVVDGVVPQTLHICCCMIDNAGNGFTNALLTNNFTSGMLPSIYCYCCLCISKYKLPVTGIKYRYYEQEPTNNGTMTAAKETGVVSWEVSFLKRLVFYVACATIYNILYIFYFRFENDSNSELVLS